MTDSQELRADAGERLNANLGEQARDHPGLVLAGGLVVGLLAGALLPRGTARRFAQSAIAAAAVGGKTSLALARHASDSARSAASDAADHLHALEEGAGENARRLRRNV